jgi:hypothetical protein
MCRLRVACAELHERASVSCILVYADWQKNNILFESRNRHYLILLKKHTPELCLMNIKVFRDMARWGLVNIFGRFGGVADIVVISPKKIDSRLLHAEVESAGCCETIAIYQCTRCYISEDSEPSTGLGEFRYRRGLCLVGRDSVVGIATRYGLYGPGIESRWGGGEIFRTSSDRSWGPPSLLI